MAIRQCATLLPPWLNGVLVRGLNIATPHRVPVFGAKDGYVSARLVRNQINAACVKTGKPLAPRERAAFDRSLRWQPRSPYQSTPVGDRAMRRCLRWLLRDHYDRILPKQMRPERNCNSGFWISGRRPACVSLAQTAWA